MHVLHVIDSLSRGGAERMLVDIANATQQADQKVSVCITRTVDILAHELNTGIEVITLNRTRRFEWNAMKHLASYLANVDVIHVHGLSSYSLVAFVRMVWQVKVPIVLHDHHSIEVSPNVPRWMRIWGASRVDEYVGVYENLRYWALRSGIPNNKITILGNCLNLDRLQADQAIDWSQVYNFTSDRFVGVIVGGIRFEKGIDILLTLLTRVTCQDQFYILVVGGERDPQYAQRCHEKSANLGLDQVVHFVGERDDIPNIISSADFALLTSRSESGPLVLIEYAYLGLPFVAFEVGNISRRMRKYGVPGFVAPGDEDSFVKELEILLNSPKSTLEERGRIGHEVVVEHFNIKSQLSAWFEIYERAIQRS